MSDVRNIGGVLHWVGQTAEPSGDPAGAVIGESTWTLTGGAQYRYLGSGTWEAGSAGSAYKAPVRCASTADVTIGTGLNSGDTLDGVTLADGDRVLLAIQTDASENGIYVVGDTPIRAPDFDDDAEVKAGTLVYISEGDTNANSWATLTTDDDIVVGTTDQAWAIELAGGVKYSPSLARVVITAAGGSGGATAGTVSVQVKTLNGTNIAQVVSIGLRMTDTQYTNDPATNAQFGAATTGTLRSGSGGAEAVVTTNAAGLYEGALANAADETVYVYAFSTMLGVTDNAEGCVVVQSIPDDATWAA